MQKEINFDDLTKENIKFKLATNSWLPKHY